MKMNRETAALVRKQLEAALATLNEAQEVKFAVNRGTFDPSLGAIKFTVEATVPGGLSEVEGRYVQWVKDQEYYCNRKVYALGETFNVQGKIVKPVGLRRTKVIIEDTQSGKRYLIAKNASALEKGVK